MLREIALSLPQFGDFKAPGGVPTGGFSTTGGKIIQTGIGIAFLFAVLLCLFVIVWGGIQWISSGGDKQKLATARSRIMYSIVGMILVLLSFVIVNLFTTFLGLPSLFSLNLLQNGQAPVAESPADAVPEQTGGVDEPAADPAPPSLEVVPPEGQPQINLGQPAKIKINNLEPGQTYALMLLDTNTEIRFSTKADGSCENFDYTIPITNLGCSEYDGQLIFRADLDTNKLGFTSSFTEYPYTLTLTGTSLTKPITTQFTVVNPNPQQ